MQDAIASYKAYAVPMDFYWPMLLYIAEAGCSSPPAALSNNSPPQEYLDRAPNSYQGDQVRAAHLAR